MQKLTAFYKKILARKLKYFTASLARKVEDFSAKIQRNLVGIAIRCAQEAWKQHDFNRSADFYSSAPKRSAAERLAEYLSLNDLLVNMI